MPARGRPLGKNWAWLKAGDALGEGLGPFDHRVVVPSLAERQVARAEVCSPPEAALWLQKERPINLATDGPDGELWRLP